MIPYQLNRYCKGDTSNRNLRAIPRRLFRQYPTEDIEKQSKAMPEEEYAEPVIQHQIPGQAQPAELVCTFLKDLALQDIVSRRISVIDLMTVLCYK